MYSLLNDDACESKNQPMRLNEISAVLRERIVSSHRIWWSLQNISAAMKVEKSFQMFQNWTDWTELKPLLCERQMKASREFVKKNL